MVFHVEAGDLVVAEDEQIEVGVDAVAFELRDEVVEPVEGVEGGPELEAEIFAYCEERLAKFKRPKSIDFTTEMPRDPNGKLYKRKLRDPYWEGRERSI